MVGGIDGLTLADLAEGRSFGRGRLGGGGSGGVAGWGCCTTCGRAGRGLSEGEIYVSFGFL